MRAAVQSPYLFTIGRVNTKLSGVKHALQPLGVLRRPAIRQRTQCKQQARKQTNRYTRSIVQMLSVPTWALQKEREKHSDLQCEKVETLQREINNN